MLRSNSVQPLLAFQCLPSCVLSGLTSEMRRACDRLHLRHRSSYQVRGSIYHAYNFQLTVPSSRIDRLLDPTTSYLCLRYKPLTAMSLHILANHVLLCYYCSLLSPCLVCMLGLYPLLSCLSLGWLSHCYILFCG